MVSRISLKKLVSNPANRALLLETLVHLEAPTNVTDARGKVLLGDELLAPSHRRGLESDGQLLGWVQSEAEPGYLLTLLEFLLRKELELRELARETLSRYKELNLIFEITEQITTRSEPQALEQFLVHKAQEMFPYGQAYVFHHLPGSQFELSHPAPSGPQPWPQDLFAEIWDNKEAEIVHCSSEDPRCSLEALGVQSLMAAPLKTQSGLFGLFLVLSQERDFQASDLKLLRTLTSQGAIAIENARSTSELRLQRLFLEERTEELRAALGKLEQADQVRSRFLANTSHELRTPLNAIIGYAELLIEEVEELALAELAQDAQKIRTASAHLLELVNDLLDLSKIESGRDELRLQTFGIEPLLLEVELMIRPMVPASTHFSLEVGEGVGSICGDFRRLKQLLLNLLSNACKFTPQGQIVLSVSQSEQEVSFRVRDTGQGIREEKQAMVFEPFAQAHSSGRGTGLGLAISKAFCEGLGGSLQLKSSWGEGTEIIATLPCQPAQRPNEPSKKPAGQVLPANPPAPT